MRKEIKRIVPKKFLSIGLNILHNIYYLYYSQIFSPLIVRKNTSDKNVFRQIFITRDYNLNLGIKPKLIIDAGANVGYSSLWFSKKYPHSKIIAIEPENSNYEILKKHIIGIKNIIPLKAGLWYKRTRLRIINEFDEKWAFQTKENIGKKEGIKAVTIGEILKESKFKKIDILKIDIEGAEKELFSKNTDWIEKVNIIIIELHDWLIPNSSSSFYSVIKKKDWNIKKKGENLVLIRRDLLP